MPKSARLLRFPVKPALADYSAAEIASMSDGFLAVEFAHRPAASWAALENPDVTLSVLSALKTQANGSPEKVHREAESLYEYLKAEPSIGLFDEKHYFLGEAALIAGNTARLLGRFETAETWLEIADHSFRNTINAAPMLARVSHARLVVRHELRRFSQVLAVLPSVIEDFVSFGMETDALKARFLEALTLKEIGESDKSLTCLLGMRDSFGVEDASFRALVLTNIAEEYARRSEPEKSLQAYQQALKAVEETGEPIAAAQLKGSIGEAYRSHGEYRESVDCFRAAIAGFSSLGMETRVAYLRVVLAECLLAAGRNREAEWEILAALPIIEDQKMVAEGLAAVSLLRQSVAQRRTDPAALAELRQNLRTI